MSSDKNKPTITPMENGPYIVKDLTAFSNRKGAVETKSQMALCRCGKSENKPFCDGAHATVGFSSAKLEERVEDKRVDYAGDKITIHDNRGNCAHAGKCTDGLPSVFKLKEEPWIDPDAAGTDDIIATIRKCPSGSLSYTFKGLEHRNREGGPSIFIVPNGPYVVTGGPELADTEWAQDASTEHFTLCRCGASRNKPFCDGAHWEEKFVDDKN